MHPLPDGRVTAQETSEVLLWAFLTYKERSDSLWD